MLQLNKNNPYRFLNPIAWLVILLIVGSVVLPTSSVVASQSDVDRLEQQSAQLEAEIKEKEAAAADARAEADALSGEVGQLDNDISLTEARISETATKISDVESSISQTNEEIKVQQASLEEQERNQDETLRVFYETVTDELLFVLVGSNSISEVIDHNEYLESLEGQIEGAIAEIEKLKRELQEKKTGLEQEETELANLKAQHEAYKIGLVDEKARKDALLSDAVATQKSFEDEVAEAEALNDKVEAELRSVRSKLTQKSGPGVIKASDQGTSAVGFQWPTNYRYISTYFGGSTPFQPGGGHGGLDLVNSAGTPIYAAADGTVTAVTSMTYNGSYYAYGNYIVVGHNARWSSLYAHLQAFAVSAGQEVHRGDVIGYMGSTGWSTGPHLHFEIWEYSARVNPLGLLP
ncbi:peptidoglycan DD-metalloendopeptidase family protein [Candidatus Berkelbacteria bacterium]|nr:peptidoglycan DD-metalloendopeptidase family protein [Candidatus Berkelbacteria bacterium]